MAGAKLMAEGLLNAAASRFYYALYHAAWRILARKGKDPRTLPARREQANKMHSWPHVHLLNNTNEVTQAIPNPLAGQIFGKRLHENYKKFYTHRVAADYLPSGVTAARLKEDSAELEKLVLDLLKT